MRALSFPAPFRTGLLVLVLTLTPALPAGAQGVPAGDPDPNFVAGGRDKLPWQGPGTAITKTPAPYNRYIVAGQGDWMGGGGSRGNVPVPDGYGDANFSRFDPDGSWDRANWGGGPCPAPWDHDGDPQTPDVQHGNNCGVATFQFDQHTVVYDVAIQPSEFVEGRTVGAGSAGTAATLYRMTENGNVDGSFGTRGDGTVVFQPNGCNAAFLALAIQPDRKIVAVGTAACTQNDNQLLIARFEPDAQLNADGQILDTTFGDGGFVMEPGSVGSSEVLLLPDGKILVGATGPGAGGLLGHGLFRYTANGQLDESFGEGGKALHPIPYIGDPAISALARQSDGKLLLGGGGFFETENTIGFAGLALTRLNADGSLDNTFGNGGTQLTAVIGDSCAGGISALQVQGDGRIVAAGAIHGCRGGDVAGGAVLARFHQGGSLDTTFGDAGKVIDTAVDGSGNPPFWADSVLDPGDEFSPAGRIAVVGSPAAFQRYSLGVESAKNSQPPSITPGGTVRDRDTLTAVNGTWTPPAGAASNDFSPRWLRCDDQGKNCLEIALPEGGQQDYTLTTADIGHRLRVRVTVVSGYGAAGAASNSAQSAATAVVQAIPPSAEADPTISGTAREGSELAKTSDGEWDGSPPLTFSQRWMSCSSPDDTATCEPIDGATGNSFRPTDREVGRHIRLRVTASNAELPGGGTTHAYSRATAAVLEGKPPMLTLTGGPEGAINETSVSFDFEAEAGATLECRLDDEADPAEAFEACASPKDYEGLAEGEYSFTVRASDAAGNQSQKTREFTVDLSARDRVSEDVAPGDSVSTDSDGSGPSESDPVEIELTSPNAGTVELTDAQVTEGEPAGYDFLGLQAEISAPQGSATEPLRIAFSADASIVPEGGAAAIEIFRNGVLVPDCTGPADVADPDPCVASRERLTGGDVRITVLTSAASSWNLGTAEATAPPPDSDRDGVPDASDACPTVAAATRDGCPATPPPPSPPAPPVADTTGPAIAVSTGKLDAKKGIVTVRVACPAGEALCSGTMKLTAPKQKGLRKPLKLGSASFQATGAKTAIVKVKLSSKARKLLAKARKLKVAAEVVARDALGNATLAKKSFVIKAGRR